MCSWPFHGVLLAGSSTPEVPAGCSLRLFTQYQRGVVLPLGQAIDEVRRPVVTPLIPVVDRPHRVDIQVITTSMPAHEGITRPDVTVRMNAVVNSGCPIPCV